MAEQPELDQILHVEHADGLLPVDDDDAVELGLLLNILTASLSKLSRSIVCGVFEKPIVASYLVEDARGRRTGACAADRRP